MYTWPHVYIYVCGTPKTYLSSKFSGVYGVSLLVIKNCIFLQFCSHPIPPFLKYIGPKIQDSRFKIPKNLLESKGSRFKIPKRLLESKGVGFKIQDPKTTSWIQRGRSQDSRSQKNFLNPRGQDSRFKIPKRLLESKGVGVQIQDPKITSCIQDGRIQDSRSRRPSALNLESKEVGLKKLFLSLESWILNPKRLDSRSFSEPWILNPDT